MLLSPCTTKDVVVAAPNAHARTNREKKITSKAPKQPPFELNEAKLTLFRHRTRCRCCWRRKTNEQWKKKGLA